MIFMPEADDNTITNGKEQISNCLLYFPNSYHNFDILTPIIYLAVIIVLVFCTTVLILLYRKNQIIRIQSFQAHDTPKLDEFYITK